MINRSGLILRLALVVLISAVTVGAIVTQVFFQITLANEEKASQVKIEQLYKTVSSTASIASYLEDIELVNEVISGLISNDIIKSVAINTDSLSSASANHRVIAESRFFDLYSPFENTRIVGTLVITPDTELMKARANKHSWDNQVALITQTTLITLTIIVVSYLMITLPITNIAEHLHQITPGTRQRIAKPAYHSNSELGLLVTDINTLLEKSSEQILKERELREQVEDLSKHFRLLFAHASSATLLTEPDGTIVLHNEAFAVLLERLGIRLKCSYGRYLKELFEQPLTMQKTISKALSNEETASIELQLKSCRENNIWVQLVVAPTLADDFHEYYHITLHDISLKRHQLEQLNLTASTDKLTNLLNRRGAEQHAQELIEAQQPFALMLLDLNKFKPINDIYGHDVGDEVLIYIASRLLEVAHGEALVSRWGGDEFVLLVPTSKTCKMERFALQLANNIAKPQYLKSIEREVVVGTSIGIAIYPDDETKLPELLRAADKAMYSLKKQSVSKNPIAFA